jgi:hypothetical protein
LDFPPAKGGAFEAQYTLLFQTLRRDSEKKPNQKPPFWGGWGGSFFLEYFARFCWYAMQFETYIHGDFSFMGK